MTVRFKNELVRNITIKLGYANAKVRSYVHGSRSLASNLMIRFTNVRMKLVRGLAVTVRILPTRKITHHANGQVVVIG